MLDQPDVLGKTTERLFAGISVTRSNRRPCCPAQPVTSSRPRKPQRGARRRRSRSKAALLGSLGCGGKPTRSACRQAGGWPGGCQCGGSLSPARADGGFCGLKPDPGMLAVAKWLCRRSAATTQENPALSRKVVEIAVAIAQLKLAQISGQEIWAVLCRNNLYRHAILPTLLFATPCAPALPAHG